MGAAHREPFSIAAGVRVPNAHVRLANSRRVEGGTGVI